MYPKFLSYKKSEKEVLIIFLDYPLLTLALLITNVTFKETLKKKFKIMTKVGGVLGSHSE